MSKRFRTLSCSIKEDHKGQLDSTCRSIGNSVLFWPSTDVLISSSSPQKEPKTQTLKLSQILELKGVETEKEYKRLVSNPYIRERFYSRQKVDPSIYKKKQELKLNNTFCVETRNKPNLLGESVMKHAQHQRMIQNEIDIALEKSMDWNSCQGKKNMLVDLRRKSFGLGLNQRKSYLQEENLTEQEDICYEEEYSHISEEVLKYVMKGREYFSKGEPELLKRWIECLPQEERLEVEKDKTSFPVPHRLLAHQINQGLNQLYGTGQQRILRPGEEASVIESFQKYLQRCQDINEFKKLSASKIMSKRRRIIDFCSIIHGIFEEFKLSYLESFPLAMKQVECYWKIMATRFQSSEKAPRKNKFFDKYVILAGMKGHFLPLDKEDHPLVCYIERYSCRRQDYLKKMNEIDSRAENKKLQQHRRESKINPTFEGIVNGPQHLGLIIARNQI